MNPIKHKYDDSVPDVWKMAAEAVAHSIEVDIDSTLAMVRKNLFSLNASRWFNEASHSIRKRKGKAWEYALKTVGSATASKPNDTAAYSVITSMLGLNNSTSVRNAIKKAMHLACICEALGTTACVMLLTGSGEETASQSTLDRRSASSDEDSRKQQRVRSKGR